MVNIETGLAINTAVSGDRTTAGGMRRALASLFKQTAAGEPTPGVIAIFGLTPLDVTTDGSTMTYHVSGGFAVTGRSGQGVYIVGSISDVNISASVGNGTNPRIDRIYIVQPDPELAESGVARIAVVEGTPAGSPALPALPTGALELGRKLVPAGAANTSTGTAISNKAPLTGLNVGWDQVVGKPSTFAPSAHTHPAGDITSQTLLNAGKVNGVPIFVQQTQPAFTVNPSLWVDY